MHRIPRSRLSVLFVCSLLVFVFSFAHPSYGGYEDEQAKYIQDISEGKYQELVENMLKDLALAFPNGGPQGSGKADKKGKKKTNKSDAFNINVELNGKIGRWLAKVFPDKNKRDEVIRRSFATPVLNWQLNDAQVEVLKTLIEMRNYFESIGHFVPHFQISKEDTDVQAFMKRIRDSKRLESIETICNQGDPFSALRKELLNDMLLMRFYLDKENNLSAEFLNSVMKTPLVTMVSAYAYARSRDNRTEYLKGLFQSIPNKCIALKTNFLALWLEKAKKGKISNLQELEVEDDGEGVQLTQIKSNSKSIDEYIDGLSMLVKGDSSKERAENLVKYFEVTPAARTFGGKKISLAGASEDKGTIHLDKNFILSRFKLLFGEEEDDGL